MCLVDFQTFDAFGQVELVQIVEGHQMAVSSEDVHHVVENADALSVPCAGFLADDKSVSLVVNDLLFQLFVVGLLVSNRLESFQHRFGGG